MFTLLVMCKLVTKWVMYNHFVKSMDWVVVGYDYACI